MCIKQKEECCQVLDFHRHCGGANDYRSHSVIGPQAGPYSIGSGGQQSGCHVFGLASCGCVDDYKSIVCNHMAAML